MLDDLTPPPDGDAMDDSTASIGADPGPTREAYDIPEWVSEVRRLYVEPKTRAKMREEGAGARHRRLSGIRPSRRTAAPATPSVVTPGDVDPQATTAGATPDATSAPSGASARLPLTPALPLPPASAAPVAGVEAPTPGVDDVASPAAPIAPASSTPYSAATPPPPPAGPTSAAPAMDPVPSATSPAAATGAPSANGSEPSSASEPWIPPTWASSRVATDAMPVDHRVGPQAPTATAGGDDPADVPVAGSALARFALSADAAAVDARTEASQAPSEPEPEPELPETLAMPVVVAVETPHAGATAGAAMVPPLEQTPAPAAPVPAAPVPAVPAPAAPVPAVPVPAVPAPAVPAAVAVSSGIEGAAATAPTEQPTSASTAADPGPDLRGAGPGRPHTVPAVHLSWREADSLDLGVPSVDDSSDAIVLEPPSQLVADTRRRSVQRRRTEEAEEAIWAPLEDTEDAGTSPAGEDGGTSSGDDADGSSTRAGSRAAARGSSAGRALSRPVLIAIAVAVLLVLLVVGWLVLGGDGSDGAAGPRGVVSTGAATAAAVHPSVLAT
ncbi:MAG TPA: hypothetical protein VFI44_10445 [Ornithinibacter sp.]|nr:hypothetical protein [Ornithinibacter sp.]